MNRKTYTNKTLTKVCKDRFGRTIFQSVETVTAYPKSKEAKDKVNLKLKIEEKVAQRQINPYDGNRLFKIVKQPKMKYKRHHWYIHHEIVNFNDTIETKLNYVQIVLFVIAKFDWLSGDVVKVLWKEIDDAIVFGVIHNIPDKNVALDITKDISAEFESKIRTVFNAKLFDVEKVVQLFMKRYAKVLQKYSNVSGCV